MLLRESYEITMFYVALSHVNQNIERVAMRVRNGGHHIATEDIIRRDKTSFDNLYQYAYLVDNLILIDNSEDDGQIILEVNNGHITFQIINLPACSIPILERFQQ
ncbi:hypothetical protein [Sporosarcina cascadiensis]|uniref:hypothetical protein n=1 Tax=Sporosarcina cascadiensis TaxID=2660747 RepID=UPI001E42F7A6|nr:hypothetical protein [Sporosarcina cascadiensis]